MTTQQGLQEKKEPLIRQSTIKQPQKSYSKQYPNIFRWKAIALIVLLLIAVSIVANVLMYISLTSQRQPTNDFTFANDIVLHSTIFKNSADLVQLIESMSLANPQTKYQFAHLLKRGTGASFTFNSLKNSVFRVSDNNLLFIFQVKGKNQSKSSTVGIYAYAAFPIPSDHDWNESIQYYTFEYGQNRKSAFLSFENGNRKYLKANATLPQDFDIRNCTTYTLSQKAQEFSMLSIMQLKLNSELQLKWNYTEFNWQCFEGVSNEGDLKEAVRNIFSFEAEETVDLMEYEVFHLFNN